MHIVLILLSNSNLVPAENEEREKGAGEKDSNGKIEHVPVTESFGFMKLKENF